MAVLSINEIERFIRYTEEQLENERIIYGSKIEDNVKELAASKISGSEEESPHIYMQQWMLLNLPQIQSDKASMQSHYEKVMAEKFEYYNRTGNHEGLKIWISSLLKNIGFTEYQAEQFISAAAKIGERLYGDADH